MDHVKDTAMIPDCLDNLYDEFKYYDKFADLGKREKMLAEIGGKTFNVAWLYGKFRSGYKVVGVGIDIGKTARNSSYMIESIFCTIWKSRNLWK